VADYEQGWAFMIPHEDYTLGGEVQIDSDGGKERFGLDSVSNPELVEQGFYDMPVEEALPLAKQVYRAKYWNGVAGDSILNQDVANKVFDMGVNTGIYHATRTLQKVVFPSDVTEWDGKMGPRTLAGMNAMNPDAVLSKLRDLWLAYIQRLIVLHPEWVKYENGWNARAEA
jgi:lysozyme family protein